MGPLGVPRGVPCPSLRAQVAQHAIGVIKNNKGSLGGLLGIPWRSLGGPLGSLGALEDPLEVLGGSLGAPWGSLGGP